MFTGIIEVLGRVEVLENKDSNLDITIASPISDELKIDQSVSHNGVCLTVVALEAGRHTVTAVRETLVISNLNDLKVGDYLNLERCVRLNERLDGHLVQGHVDSTGICNEIISENGSWRFRFAIDKSHAPLLISKGSVCINGVSLTVIEPSESEFSIAIIPYTFEHTTFGNISVGDIVNLEFDVIGKYLQRHLQLSSV